jgi:hypothetical protein
MRTLIPFVLVAATADPAGAADHLVGPSVRDARLQGTIQRRARDRVAVERLLDSPTAQRAGARIGVDLSSTRTSLGALTDSELRDLSQRVKALEADPATGLTSSTNDILIVALIVLIVLLVLKAI